MYCFRDAENEISWRINEIKQLARTRLIVDDYGGSAAPTSCCLGLATNVIQLMNERSYVRRSVLDSCFANFVESNEGTERWSFPAPFLARVDSVTSQGWRSIMVFRGNFGIRRYQKPIKRTAFPFGDFKSDLKSYGCVCAGIPEWKNEPHAKPVWYFPPWPQHLTRIRISNLCFWVVLFGLFHIPFCKREAL